MYDLIIAGAGPAGATAARVAGKQGLKTLLLEKAQFPRYKACAGAVSEHALSFLDFELPASLQERDIYGARTHFHDHVVETHKDYRIATLVTRSAFDLYLLEQAKETGIECQTGVRVVDFQEKRDEVYVYTGDDKVYRTKFFILAEGAKGRLHHRIQQKDTKKEYGICLVTEIPVEDSRRAPQSQSAMDIYFGVANMGYGWVFAHDTYFSVGIGGIAEHLHYPVQMMKNFLTATGFLGDFQLKGHLIPVGGLKRQLTGSRTLLVGDCAGFVDTFTGEGIAYAIQSGILAVEVLTRILKEHRGIETLKDYKKICHTEFEKNLRYSLLFAKIMHRFPNLLFTLFIKHQEIFETYLDVPSGKISYQAYMRWLVPRIPQFLIK